MQSLNRLEAKEREALKELSAQLGISLGQLISHICEDEDKLCSQHLAFENVVLSA